jgi:hypothetical protein
MRLGDELEDRPIDLGRLLIIREISRRRSTPRDGRDSPREIRLALRSARCPNSEKVLTSAS